MHADKRIELLNEVRRVDKVFPEVKIAFLSTAMHGMNLVACHLIKKVSEAVQCGLGRIVTFHPDPE